MRTIALIAALLACLSATAASAADSAVVLMYHRFADYRFPSTNIRTEQFEAHLDYLQENDYSVIPLQTLMAGLAGEESLPERAVVITVDDAYLSVYEVAHPILESRGYPYTVFVSTDGVDKGLADFMTWDQMREMQEGGATFANHGASHGSLINRSRGGDDGDYLDWVESDVSKGWTRLAEELDPVEGAFAYPYGEYNAAVQARLSGMGYTVAFGQQSGALGPLTDRLALPRFPMNENYGDMDQFPTKISSLPLPVEAVSPADPEIQTRLPLIDITLAGGIDSGDYSGIACFVGGQGRVSIEWTTPNKQFSVGPEQPLNPGRNRVNCTSPAGGGRYYWFSHPWFVRD